LYSQPDTGTGTKPGNIPGTIPFAAAVCKEPPPIVRISCKELLGLGVIDCTRIAITIEFWKREPRIEPGSPITTRPEKQSY